MSNQTMNEKEEKEEKEVSKHEEKSVEEKWRRDPLGTITWAAILIWAGIAWLLDNLGVWENWLRTAKRFGQPGKVEIFWVGGDVWAIIMIGAGILLFIELIIRMVVPVYRRPVGGTLFLSVLFVCLGLSNFIGWTYLLPIALLTLGLSILLRGFFRKA